MPQFATEMVAPDKRYAVWRQLGRDLLDLELELENADRGELLRVVVDSEVAGPIAVTRASFQDHPTEHGRSGRDNALAHIVLQHDGKSVIHNNGLRACLGSGDVVVCDAAAGLEYDFAGSGSMLILTAPLKSAAGDLLKALDIAGVKLNRSNGATAVLIDFLVAFARNAGNLGPAPATRLFASVVDVIRSAALATAGRTHSRGKSYMIQSARRLIEDQLRNPDLSAGWIAENLGVTRRYVNRLFEDQPLTVQECIRERRLVGSRRDLEDPARAHQSITEIAYAWGFSSASHFSRVFLQRFGTAPRKLRPAREHA